MADPKKRPQQADINPLEVVGDLGRIAYEQVLTPKALSGELKVGETLDLKAQKVEQKIDRVAQQLNSVRQQEKIVFDRETQETQKRMIELVMAIKQEVASVKKQTAALTGQVENITVEQVTKQPGLYHLNFFEWVVSMLRDLKRDIVKSRTWLGTFNARKKKKGYWAMFKKHGTSFAMSDERGIATASG